MEVIKGTLSIPKNSGLSVKREVDGWIGEKGFTLLEVLLAILIGGIILTGVCTLYLLLEKQEKDAFTRAQLNMEARAFLVYVEREIYNGYGFVSTNGKLDFYDGVGNWIRYERWGNGIRRQVNSSGHTMLLKDVDTLSFSAKPKGCFIDFTMKKGGVTWQGHVFLATRVER